jgi:hypothetical protein
MSPLATSETDSSVKDYIATIENPTKREDSETLLRIMGEVTQQEPKIWGSNPIIGFGKFTYRRKGSKEDLEWFKLGFAPRKANLTVYLTPDLTPYEEMLSRLGEHKVGKGCLYINKLADVDLDVLKELVVASNASDWISST